MQKRMSDKEFQGRGGFFFGNWHPIYEEAKRARESEKRLEKEVLDLKDECQLRWNEGEAGIQEASKLRNDIKCLEESTVDRKAWDKICDDKVNLMFKVTKLEAENAKLDRVSRDWADACQKNYEKLCSKLDEISRLKKQLEDIAKKV